MTKWIGPEEAEYDERRELFNAMINKKPRIIAACEGPADVREALERAAQDRLPVAVRSGGHSVAGQSTNDDGLVIDVRPMKSIHIDATARRARVEGGCTWAEFDVAAQEFGLATTGGRVSTTGVSGLTLMSQRSARWVSHLGDEGDERIKAAFGAETYERLAQIKSEYDPGNVFAGNQNIRPKVSA